MIFPKIHVLYLSDLTFRTDSLIVKNRSASADVLIAIIKDSIQDIVVIRPRRESSFKSGYWLWSAILNQLCYESNPYFPSWSHVPKGKVFWRNGNILKNVKLKLSIFLLEFFYHPQTKFAKVMFLQVCVCPQWGRGRAWGACMAGGACMARGHAWQGACMARGHA